MIHFQATNCEQSSEGDALQVEVDLWDDSILEVSLVRESVRY